ncbi:nuclear transport factor 2 family protein [Flavobacterium gawalongense]|uniref:Nuclear transport factor 2 family protein n=1 Tax=Flavobacterium gawalongense TaxID=2594432 RepID=A0ABY3CGE8_9FLAO|nr:nuclear transport factor 2 family protein [Flavobacterium gawalongense]TRX00626.1 nuclear transport factor 2 family protein [Flavobacterium gawalongense]TRX01970.1 nuclear transport factor 2 family protein [Flavobacterium gawalongense]
MKKIVLFSLSILLFSAFTPTDQDTNKEKDKVNTLLDAWHKAAAEANYNAYFNLMTEDAIFIGTDATENWNKTAFQAFAKPYFDKGKTWNFTALERHIYFDKTGKIAWFDELLNAQMKICRGSGVVVKIGKEWKIKHYVLSMTVPNDNVDAVIKIKAPLEDTLLKNLQNK